MPAGRHKNAHGPRPRWRGRLLPAGAVAVLAVLAFVLVRLLDQPLAPPRSPVIEARTGPAPVATTTVTARPPAVTPTAGPSGTSPRIRPSSSSAPPAGTPGPTTGAGAPSEGRDEGAAATMRRGDAGDEVLRLQERLRQVGIQTAQLTGTYDQPTEAAVQNYQALRKIVSDPQGVYGPATRSALEAET
ncbi:peptidoglycan-binding domain-containing protein [Streptomyces zingiberis]|uniref:Peptidoglycan binding-like domain-containing protein n=1 Tax=Streptomyces zingiberis TaxID=2053010 RepID=A0ABX1C0T2_9ACTN|nr:peptidoglycan-binding domain-containing protein [Streptomyces zingiberis]NJQ03471.1 hypothetical protein [Streptomyces zingiberis]